VRNVPEEFLQKVEERFISRRSILEDNCHTLYGKSRTELIKVTYRRDPEQSNFFHYLSTLLYCCLFYYLLFFFILSPTFVTYVFNVAGRICD